MSDYHPVLQYAQYRLKDKTGVPMDLLTGNEAHFALGNKVLPETSLKREADVRLNRLGYQDKLTNKFLVVA